jgi:hypothetical protein
MTNRLENLALIGKRNIGFPGEPQDIKWVPDPDVAECQGLAWGGFWKKEHCDHLAETIAIVLPNMPRHYTRVVRIYDHARAWANEARLVAMQATVRSLVSRDDAEHEEQALVQNVKSLTEEFLGSPVGLRRTEDPGETPYTTLIVRVASDQSAKDVADLHERWHDMLVDKAPEAIGKIRLNVAFE